MTRRGGHLLFWLVVTVGLAADLLSKHFVFKFLSTSGYRVHEVWAGVFRLSLHYNTGGPFSLFAGFNSCLIVVTVAALAVIFYLYAGAARRGRRLALVALAFVASGALGNLVDRVHGGRVRDFLDFHVINYPVFNVADVLITVGVVLLVFEILRRDSSWQKSGGGRA